MIVTTHRQMRVLRHRPTASGFTLIEVLVSVVVLSIGLLGIGKLVLYSSRANDSAYLRSQATELAYAMVDNMRANRTAATNKSYDIAITAGAPTPAPLVTCVSFGAPCASTNLALFDLATWKLRLAAAMPAGQGSVVTNTVNSQTTAVITVQWDDSVAQSTFKAVNDGTASPLTVTLETVL